jgi:hypothetical protein
VKIPNFPRYIVPDFLQYINERLEVAPPWHPGSLAKAAITRSQGKPKQEKEIINS